MPIDLPPLSSRPMPPPATPSGEHHDERGAASQATTDSRSPRKQGSKKGKPPSLKEGIPKRRPKKQRPASQHSEESTVDLQDDRPAAKLRRQQKLKVLWQQRFTAFARFVLGMVLLYGCGWVWLQSPAFILPATSESIHLEGQQLLSAEALRYPLQFTLGKPLYQWDALTLAESLKQRFPLLAQVQVRKTYWPQAHVDVVVSEFQPWGLVYLPNRQLEALTWFKQYHQWKRLHPNEPARLPLMPKPHTVVLDSYQSIRLEANHGAIQPAWLSRQSVLLFVPNHYLGTMKREHRFALFKTLDRLVQGVGELQYQGSAITPLAVTITPDREVHLTLLLPLSAEEQEKQAQAFKKAWLQQHPHSPLPDVPSLQETVVHLGTLDKNIALERAMLLKPLLRLMAEQNKPVVMNPTAQGYQPPKQVTPRTGAIDIIDLRWGKSISLHRRETGRLPMVITPPPTALPPVKSVATPIGSTPVLPVQEGLVKANPTQAPVTPSSSTVAGKSETDVSETRVLEMATPKSTVASTPAKPSATKKPQSLPTTVKPNTRSTAATVTASPIKPKNEALPRKPMASTIPLPSTLTTPTASEGISSKPPVPQ
ncbi:MAG: FtsQ-type POTRA domain-containing protein [Vampirovibrionales bacterium]